MESDVVSPVFERHAIDGTGPQHDPTRAYAVLVSMVDAVYCVDTAGCFTFTNAAFEAMTGYALVDLLGTPSTQLYVPEAEALFRERRRQVYSGAPVPPLVETVLLLKDGRRLPVEVSVSSLIMEGQVVGRVGVLRDISERKAAEAALRESEGRLRAVIETAVDGIITIDERGQVNSINPAAVRLFGYAPENVIGRNITLLMPEPYQSEHEAHLDHYMQTGTKQIIGSGREVVGRRKDGSTFPMELSVSETQLDNRRLFTGIVRDISPRKAVEDTLRVRARQQQAVAQLGELALRERALQTVFARAVATVAETLAVEYCKMLELLPGGDALRLRAGVGWRAGLVGTATVSTGLNSQAGYTLLSDAPVVVADLRQEQRFSGPPLLVEHGVISGMSYIIRGTDGTPWGVLGAHSSRRLTFTQDDVNFLAAVANILSDAIARERAEAALREREEHIRRLNTYLQADLAHMTRLQQVSTRLVQTHDVAALLDEILDAALAITDADMGNIQLLDGDTLKIVAHRGFEAPFLDFFNTVHEGLAACGTALQCGERIIVEDVTTSPLFVGSPAYDVMLAAQARAVQSTPLITRAGRMLGMFSTHYRTPHRPTPGEIHLLDILARQAADVIERAQAEAALRESEERFRVMADNLPLIVWLHDAEGRQEFVNHTFCEYFGVARAEMREDRWRMLTHPADGTAYVDEFLACVRERRPFHAEVRARRADGQWRWLESWGRPRFGPGGEFLGHIGTSADITERKRAEAALRQQREWFEVTLASIGDGVITTDTTGRITFMNAVAEALTAWPAQEALGQPIEQVFRILHETTRLPVASPVARVLQEGDIVHLANHTVLYTRDGREMVIADSGAPIRSADGDLLGVVMVFQDVSAQQQMEAELFRTRKIESVGVLAGGIAHDFNNLLTGILGNISLVKLLVSGDAKAVMRLMEAEKACQRATALTQQLLTFAKGGLPVRQTIALAPLLTESVTFALRGARVRGTFRIADDLWPVDADTGQMSQVFQNVVLNAVQAMPAGGSIEVQADNVVLRADASVPLPKGPYITVVMQDHGCGIPREVLPQIFDPYFTTKTQGSGLGLATAHAIVAKHDGYIGVDSEVGVGTTVVIYLPASQQIVPPAPVSPPVPLMGHGRILVMDDEDIICDLLRECLPSLGYEVECVRDGRAAIAAYQQAQAAGQPFAAVILDSTIPGGMGGRETVTHLRALNPQVVALLSSGYANASIMANPAQEGFCGIITKPYTVEKLQEALQRVLLDGHGTPEHTESSHPCAR